VVDWKQPLPTRDFLEILKISVCSDYFQKPNGSWLISYIFNFNRKNRESCEFKKRSNCPQIAHRFLLEIEKPSLLGNFLENQHIWKLVDHNKIDLNYLFVLRSSDKICIYVSPRSSFFSFWK